MSSFLRAAVRTGLFLVLVAAAVFGGYLAAPPGDGGGRQPVPMLVEGMVAKEAVSHDLIEGRLALPGAIERFRAINEVRPGFSWETFRARFPGATDEECLGRQVILYAAQELRDQPERADALVARLNAELTSYATPGAGSLDR